MSQTTSQAAPRRRIRAPSLINDLKDPRSSAQRLADARREFIAAHGLAGEEAELAAEAIGFGFYAAPVAKMYVVEEPGMIVSDDGEVVEHSTTEDGE